MGLGTVSLTGNDSIKIAGRIFTDLANGDAVQFEPPNNIGEADKGKNGNAIFALNETGTIVEVTIRLILASPDDKFLNSQIALWRNDTATYPLMGAEFTKRTGDGRGQVNNVIYKLSGGYPMRYPAQSTNVEGNVEQSIAVWQLRFANADRIIE